MEKRNEIIDDDEYGEEIFEDDFFGFLMDLAHEETVLGLREEN